MARHGGCPSPARVAWEPVRACALRGPQASQARIYSPARYAAIIRALSPRAFAVILESRDDAWL